MADQSGCPGKGKYGQIAGNSRISALIYDCFLYISEEDERKFVKQFRKQDHDSDQVMHTLRELVLGAYLSSRGLRVEYDRAMDSQTPDWCIVDDKSAVIGIVEVSSFHIDKATNREIEEQMKSRKRAVFWRDGNKDNVERLYHCIWDKAQRYRALVGKLRLPYVVAVFGQVEAAVDFEEVCLCLLDEQSGLFDLYPQLSGVLYFQESFGRYVFQFAQNPNAMLEIALPVGVFPAGAA